MMGRRPCVLIVGYYGFSNVGDEAVLAAMLNDFRAVVPDLEVIITSNEPGRTATITAGLSEVDWRDLGQLIACIERSDVVVVGGGGLFNSYLPYDPGALLTGGHSLFAPMIFGMPALARLLGKPCIIYGVGVSEITSHDARYHARMAVELASACTVRDEHSRERLIELGCTPERIEVTADAAFRLTPVDTATVHRLLEKEDVRLSRPLVAVSLRNWNFHGDQQQTELAVAEALSVVARETGASLLFIPFEKSASPGEVGDDRTVIERVIAHLDDGSSWAVLRGDYSPAEIAGVIGTCDLVIGMRLHSVILSIVGQTPFVALGYEPKVRGLLEMVGLDHLVLDVASINVNDLVRSLRAVVARHGEVRHELALVAADLARRAWMNVERTMELIDKPAVEPPATAGTSRFLQELALKQTRRLLDLQRQCEQANVERRALAHTLRNLVAEGELDRAAVILQRLLMDVPEQPEWNYLLAYCLHTSSADLQLAVEHYNRALDRGFDPFWVLYNRGSLFAKLGLIDLAATDLRAAHELQPDHAGPAAVLAELLQ